jgi:microcin C transport system ATP-binding protein
MNAPAPALLELESLDVRFGTTHAVRELSLRLHAGEKLALVGESGSGKSVTALALLRLLRGATVKGRILFEGQELLGLPEERMRALRGSRIAMVFQEPMTALNPVHSVGRQIAEVLQLHASTTTRTSSPVASASGWSSPWPWPVSPGCWCVTSRRRRWT